MKQRRKNYNALIVYIFSGFFAFFVNASLAFPDQEWSGTRPPNCKCHSKNRKMVEMHKPFGVKDCLVCHKPDTMQMQGKGEEGKPKKMEIARQKKKDEKVCKGCHTLKDNLADTLKYNSLLDLANLLKGRV